MGRRQIGQKLQGGFAVGKEPNMLLNLAFAQLPREQGTVILVVFNHHHADGRLFGEFCACLGKHRGWRAPNSGRRRPATGWSFLHPRRANFAGSGGAFPRFASSRSLGVRAHVATAACFLAAAALFVDRFPRSLFSDRFGSASMFVTFFYMLGLALLLGGVLRL